MERNSLLSRYKSDGLCGRFDPGRRHHPKTRVADFRAGNCLATNDGVQAAPLIEHPTGLIAGGGTDCKIDRRYRQKIYAGENEGVRVVRVMAASLIAV
jgi:hypothetical protein